MQSFLIGQGRPMVLNARHFALATLAVVSLNCISTNAVGQVMPYRAAPTCKGPCGSPLCGPCNAHAPYNYVPTKWRRWPVVQASATMAPEELPVPTPAKVPREQQPSTDDLVPQLPMTPDLPEGTPGPTTQPSGPLTPPFGESPSSLPFGDQPRVPVFGDDPQAPPSAADPQRSPFSDEPPQPPAEGEEPLHGNESTTPAAPGIPGATTTPGAGQGEASSPDRPDAGMPFDVGPPQMPADDPFKDDPDQEPNTGARHEQAYRETYGIARTDASGAAESRPSESADADEPRLLHADGGSLEAARLPAEQIEPNPLRQVSHPGRRTVATGTIASPSKPSAGWRRNPLRER